MFSIGRIPRLQTGPTTIKLDRPCYLETRSLPRTQPTPSSVTGPRSIKPPVNHRAAKQ